MKVETQKCNRKLARSLNIQYSFVKFHLIFWRSTTQISENAITLTRKRCLTLPRSRWSSRCNNLSINFWLIFRFLVLSKLLASLNEVDNKFSGDKELHFLQSLLQSKEINALVNVHHKVAKVGKDDRIAPILSASMQVVALNIDCEH